MRKYRNAASDYEYGAMLGENLSFAASEAYKLLRTNLDFALSDEQKCRIIGMTSSVRGEGKSTTTLNLAYSIAEAGKLVLVIEADMRMPTYTKRLHIQTKKGISNLLAPYLMTTVNLDSRRAAAERKYLQSLFPTDVYTYCCGHGAIMDPNA